MDPVIARYTPYNIVYGVAISDSNTMIMNYET